MRKEIIVEDLSLISLVLGSLNKQAKEIEYAFVVKISTTEKGLAIEGNDLYQLEAARKILERLFELAKRGVPLTQQLFNYLLSQTKKGNYALLESFHPDTICVTARGKQIQCKTEGQKKYVKAIKEHDVTFVNGPAGTGKTYLAVALAVQYFREQKVDRIILTRPAVEAGEKLGFLPGDLQMKVDPYMRPLYDALHDLLGPEVYQRLMEKTTIEVSPLAYMRGRTLEKSFIILDEAQNTSPEQMKMFLTRIGFDSKVIVTGDTTQIDLQDKRKSGLLGIKKILKDVSEIAFITLTSSDVVRADVVQKIIEAYAKYEGKQK